MEENPFVPFGSISESEVSGFEAQNWQYLQRREEEENATEFSTLTNLFHFSDEKLTKKEQFPSPGFERLMYYLDTVSWIVGREWFKEIVPEVMYDWKTYKLKREDRVRVAVTSDARPGKVVHTTSPMAGMVDPTAASLTFTPLARPVNPGSVVEKTGRTAPSEKEISINPSLLKTLRWQKQLYDWCQVFSLEYLLNRVIFILEDSHDLLQSLPYVFYQVEKLKTVDPSGNLLHPDFDNLHDRYLTIRGRTFRVHTVMICSQLWADTIYRREMTEAQTLVSKPLTKKIFEHWKGVVTQRDSIPSNIELPDNLKQDTFISDTYNSAGDDFVNPARAGMSPSGERKKVKKGDLNWVDDSKVPWCFDCKCQFYSFPKFFRKYHCCGCGQVFCDNCLTKQPDNRKCRRCIDDDARLSLSRTS